MTFIIISNPKFISSLDIINGGKILIVLCPAGRTKSPTLNNFIIIRSLSFALLNSAPIINPKTSNFCN